MKLLNEIKEVIEFYRWCAIASWRMSLGRLYIVRDAPLHFVAYWAACEPTTDDAALELHLHCTQELNLRMRQMTRQVEDMAAKAAAAAQQPQEPKS